MNFYHIDADFKMNKMNSSISILFPFSLSLSLSLSLSFLTYWICPRSKSQANWSSIESKFNSVSKRSSM